MIRPIALGLAPNMESDDVWIAVITFLNPFLWKQNTEIEKVEKWFLKTFDTDWAVSFNSGRVGLLGILKAMDIGAGDEVLVQGFTCVAVPNSVLWAGARPVYVDIDSSLNVDPVDAEKKITTKTKAIIVQHTFGIPGQIEQLQKLAKKHNLFFIEDCAHALGGEYNGKKLGMFGDAAFFSFGRDKMISSIFGGVAITKDRAIGQKLLNYQQTLSFPSFMWIAQQLVHPLLFLFILPLYQVGLGKLLLFVSQKIHLLSFPVYHEEKQGKIPDCFPAKFPGAFASLAFVQLQKLNHFTQKRASASKHYRDALSQIKTIESPSHFYKGALLRFPLLVKNRDTILAQAKKQGISLGDWYKDVIAPAGVSYDALYCEPKKLTKAANASKRIINLPTYPTLTQKDIEKVINFLKNNI